jgi:hypothetical protein
VNAADAAAAVADADLDLGAAVEAGNGEAFTDEGLVAAWVEWAHASPDSRMKVATRWRAASGRW